VTRAARFVLKPHHMPALLRSTTPGPFGRDTAVLILSLFLGFVASACGAPSADDIKKEFTAYVAGANSCTAAADCTVVVASCPLECWVAVRADRQADVEAKARALVTDYERGGESCAYDCVAPGPTMCVQGRCYADPVTTEEP
jgi:hypothetical protein